LIVAVDKGEVERLEKLYERGLENGVKDLKMVGPDSIKDIEPYCVVSIKHYGQDSIFGITGQKVQGSILASTTKGAQLEQL
jgi:L-2-hydroxyglutarate oxidase LhgO